MTYENAQFDRHSSDEPISTEGFEQPDPVSAEPNPWGPLIPLGGLSAVPAFDSGLLPPAAADYVNDVADRQGSPPEFVAVSLMGALAGLVGNGVRIAPRACDDWTVVPTLWCMLIGEASMMKTPAMQAGLMPLEHLQGTLTSAYEDQREDLGVEADLARLVNLELASQARAAIGAGETEEAHRLLSMRLRMTVLPQPRLHVGDVSETRMVQLLAEHPFGLLAVHDELPGFFARLMKPSGSSERAMLLKAATGNVRHTHDRAGRAPINIPQLTLSVLGAIQPSRLASVVRDANAEGADGLLARFQVSVWPDPVPDRSGIDRRPDQAAAEAVQKIFAEAYTFSRGGTGPKILRFDAEAQDLFNDWSAKTLACADTKPSALQSHMVKSVKTAASLALLIELMAGGRQQVSVASMEMALRWAWFLAAHAERLYANRTAGTAAAERILGKRDHLPAVFTARDIYRSNWTGLGKAASEKGLGDLVRHGYLRDEVRSTGGRPTVVYCWNPMVSGDPQDAG